MQGRIPRTIVVQSLVKTLTVTATGSGLSSKAYILLPDGTKVYEAGTHEVNLGEVIQLCVKADVAARYHTIVINDEIVHQEQGTTLYTHNYTVRKDATIALKYSASSGTEGGARITVTEV